LIYFVRPLLAKEWMQRLVVWLRINRKEAAGLVALLLLSLVVRALNLEHIPANLGGDEGTQGAAALNILGPPLRNPFSTGWFSVPTMSFLAYGVTMQVFGEGVAGLRMLSALAGTITVLTTFLLGRELWGRRVAWLAAIALSCAHYHIHFSRLGSNQIFDGLFITLSLWLLVRALRSRQKIYFALAGATIGLSWYGYFGARLVGIIAACYLGWRMIVEHRFLHRYGRLLAISVIAALLVMAPLLLHYVGHSQELVSRVRQVDIFSSGWLEREQEISGRSAVGLLLQQFWKSISAFNFTLDPTSWYNASIPMLDFVSGVLFVLGLIWAMVRCRWANNGMLMIWFWLALGLGWVMTENPPSSQRMNILAPALALLVGLGLNWLTELCQCVIAPFDRTANGNTGRRVRSVMTVMVLVTVLVINLRYYFFVYTPTRIYGNPTAEIATELGHHLQQQDDDSVVYFYGHPSMYWNFGTITFIARGIEGIDVLPSRGNDVPEWNLDRGARFVFLEGRLSELDAVRQRYPDGEEILVHSSVNDRLLYVMYKVKKNGQ
jgi:4-amino-4-deoxy-L-arabinose transferase-like glycosyltransferase